MPRLPLAAFAALAIAGCSLVVSTSGLSGGAEPTDGGFTSGDTAMSAESSFSDAHDAAPLFGDDADAATTSPCSQQHVFCDDFDTNDGVLGRWTTSKTGAGQLTLDTGNSRSAPRSLRMAVQPGGAPKRVSELRKELMFSSQLLHVDLDVFLGAPSGSSFVEVDSLEIAMTPTPAGFDYHALSLAMYPDGVKFEYYRDNSGSNAMLVQRPVVLPRGAWVHLAVTADFTSTTPKATLLIDGAPAAEIPIGAAGITSISLAVGATYTEQANVDWNIGFDNVVVN